MIYFKSKLCKPSWKTLKKANKLVFILQKPICFYFYVDSLNGNICISSYNNEKIIFKSNDEYTSPIKNTFKVNNEYIVVTENTIYIISALTKVK